MKRLIPFLLAALTAMAVSCTRTVYTPVTRTVERTDTLWRTMTQGDSIHVTDSVRIYMRGDTVFQDRTQKEWRERTVNDTIREKIVERDTVPVLVEVEKPLTRWQRTKQEAGGVAIGTAVAAVVALLVWLSLRKSKLK